MRAMLLVGLGPLVVEQLSAAARDEGLSVAVSSPAEALAAQRRIRADVVLLAASAFTGAAARAILSQLRGLAEASPQVIVAVAEGSADATDLLAAGADDALLAPKIETVARVRLRVARRLVDAAATAASAADRERKLRRAYDELRESDERFRIVARATNDAVWDWDLATDIVSWSDNLKTLFGYTFSGLSTPITWWEEEMHPEDRGRVIDSIKSVLELGETHWEDEYRLRRGDGSYANVYDRGIVIHDDTGKAVRMIGAIMDITERRELQARLVLADRMASVGTLAAGVAHEINNPLAYVVANVDLAINELRKLRPQVPQAGKPLEALLEARDGAERVRLIVHDLKTFSRADDAVRERVDLRRVVESSINLAINEIRHRARLTRALAPVPLVDANEGRLGQVAVNLLVNAAQAIPEGAAQEHEISVVTRTDELGNAVLEVRDTGPGMPPEILRRIFDPFYTTKSPGEGTGLGLTICHGIVSAMNGRIEVESEVGAGSLFRVVLPSAPLAEGGDDVPRPSVIAPITSEPPRGRILVVDDEPMIGKAVQLLLAEVHDVTAMVHARDARERLLAGDEYDAILCDLMMPELTGMDLHDELARRAPHVARRMIFLTGGAFTPRARSFLEQVPNIRIDKPFEAEGLLTAIASVMRATRRQNDERSGQP